MRYKFIVPENRKLLLATVLIFAFITFIAANYAFAGQLTVNPHGKLLLNGSENWSESKLKASGYNIEKSTESYQSEGRLISRKKRGLALYTVSKNGNIVFQTEPKYGIIDAITIYDSSVAIVIGEKKIRIGSSLKEIEIFGPYETLFGHDIGMYLAPIEKEYFSFHTPCSSNWYERELEHRGKTKKELLGLCKIDKFIILGDDGKKWK